MSRAGNNDHLPDRSIENAMSLGLNVIDNINRNIYNYVN